MSKNLKPTTSVTIYEYPKLVYAWPLIVLGPLFSILLSLPFLSEGGSAHEWTLELFGWIYLWTALLVVFTLGVNIERNHAIFWVVVIAAIGFAGAWLSSYENVPTVFGNIYNWLDWLNVRYDPGMGLVVSIFLAIPYSVMLVWTRLNDKWRITHNEFEHYSFGRSDDSLARGAKRVRSTYPDLFELLLCGAGTMIVYSATGRTELRRIHNVPLLPLKRRKIDRILEYRAVTLENAEIEEAQAEEEEDHERDDRSVRDNEESGPIGSEKL